MFRMNVNALCRVIVAVAAHKAQQELKVLQVLRVEEQVRKVQQELKVHKVLRAEEQDQV
jgi:hypothetical protein